ncbi:MAG: YggU family protein [Alphaproteobacteria bacterium]|nr:YggU family protein [Alphaproteobacteria bacterium]
MPITKNEKGIRLSVRVTPGAKRNAFDGMWNGTHLKISLQAPAVDGKANEALIDFLSEMLDVKKKNIFIVTGQTSRCKVVLIEQASERTEEWLKQKLLTVSK